MLFITVGALIFGSSVIFSTNQAFENVSTVENSEELRNALSKAGPGTTIHLSPGNYQGGVHASGLLGAPGRPIIIEAADPANPPSFEGGANSIQLSRPVHVELRNLILTGATGNGLNIDDGGTFETPAQHLVLNNLVVRDVGPEGNRDGIKLSGVVDFRIENCTIERWGRGGSAIDMVGCHRGEVVGSTFRHEEDADNANGVQAKGGSTEIPVKNCRFENAGGRALNIGGSTGMAYFRPKPLGYEAKAITVEDNMIIGSMAPVAFVGVDGAVVRHNTIYRPRRWALRILQETQHPDFVPSRNGQFTDNIIAFRSEELNTAINIGSGTAPETFTLARNVWYCLDDPARSQPRLPIPEEAGIYGVDPEFQDPENGNLQLRSGSRAASAGVRSEEANGN